MVVRPEEAKRIYEALLFFFSEIVEEVIKGAISH